MSIPTQSYAATFDQFSAAIRWMAELGITLNLGRASHYEKTIGHWKDAYKTASAEEGQQIFPDFVSSMFEVFDFVHVYNAFKNVPAHQLGLIVAKLQKAVNGPINVVDETPASTEARNFFFEAIVAAKAHRPDMGIEAILDARSDTAINLDGKRLWIECKRVTNVDRIEENIRKASRQLEIILADEIGSGHRGVVALDVSKILNRGDNIYVAPNDEVLQRSIERMMYEFIEKHHHIWERVYVRRHKKIIGTIVKFSFMSTSESRNLLAHTTEWAINPRQNISVSDERIQRKIVSILEQ